MKSHWRSARLVNAGRAGLCIAALALPAAGCTGTGMAPPSFAEIGKTTQRGYVISPTALEQVQVGSSKEQVEIALGSPSTTANFGGDVYYYISQTYHRGAKFLPEKVVGQRVLAVYFDKKDKVQRIANYGLKDGKVFDFISRTTPTGGRDESFLQQVLAGVVGFGSSPFGN